jgi:hypothetical protein
MRAHPTVCVQVDHISDITDWESVIARGLFEELHRDEAAAAQRLIEQRFVTRMGGTSIERAHGTGGWSNHPPTWQDAIHYRITLTAKSGRFEHP